jgi:hypothetical protein
MNNNNVRGNETAMRRAITCALALALALAGAVGAARADTSVDTDVTADTTWGGAANPCPILLELPIFVRNGATLTILPGCIVRGQPRTAAPLAGSTVGVPGSLIVTRTGRLIADGAPNAPIIFTTAAIDANGDNNPDVDANGRFLPQPCNPVGAICNPTQPYWDNDPLNSPRSVLRPNGQAAVAMWGGVAVLGNAPTNYALTAANAGLGLRYGQDLLEGIDFPGFPAAFGAFGGSDPHDDSGTLEYVSIRYAGDSINADVELNCLSLGGVGDNTKVSFVECLGNFDDGVEVWGGTVNADHLAVFYVGDDSFDFDSGYTGTMQFLLAVMTHFNQDGGAIYGASSGDKCTEWDGEDWVQDGNLANRRPNPVNLALNQQPWPYSNPVVYNFTCIGSTPAGANNAASAAGANTGIQMRNGFAGELRNAVMVNTAATGLAIVDGDGSAPDWSPELADGGGTGSNVDKGDVVVFCSTFQDVGAATGTDVNVALTNGNNRFPGSAADNNRYNAAPALALGNEVIGYDLSVANGRLASVAGAAINPRPNAGPQSVGCPAPRGPGVDATATYRGAFAVGAPALWTDGWTAMSSAGKLQ